MFRSFTRNLTKERIIGGLAISGTLYFGYKNVSAYLNHDPSPSQSSQQPSLNKNDLLSENLRKIHSNFNKKDLSLRNGDLVFIKYNTAKLGILSRSRLGLARSLCKNRIYDDLGIVYTAQDNYYILLLPSVKIRSTSGLRDLNISGKEWRGVVAVEYDDLIRENHPDLISIRRLICPDSTRESVVKSMKSAILDLKSASNSALLSVVTSWASSLPYFRRDTSQFIHALTTRDEIEHAKRSLNYNSMGAFNQVQDSFKTKSAKQHTKPEPEAPTEDVIDSLIDFEKALKEYDSDLGKCELVIRDFLEKVQDGGAEDRGRFFGTETSLATKVYSKSRLLPLSGNPTLFSIYNYCELDSLFRGLGPEDPAKYSRLSAPFNVYTGGVNRVRLQNLKYPQVRDLLEYKM